MIIGLTGQIGAGKSTVAKFLGDLGSSIVDADQIGRRVLDTDKAVKRQLVKAFGQGVVTRSGKIDRRAVASAAFASASARRRLNRIVHPPLLKELHRQVRRQNKSGKIVVIDAALLLEWKLDRKVDFVIVVGASARLRLSRMVSRGFSKADIRRRMKLQLPWAAYRKRVDIVITNAGSKTELRRAVRYIWDHLHS